MFTSNETNGILFIGSYNPNSIIKQAVCTGDDVTLYINGVEVYVERVTSQESGSCSGYIYGFGSGHRVGFGDLTIGQQVQFELSDIFACCEA